MNRKQKTRSILINISLVIIFIVSLHLIISRLLGGDLLGNSLLLLPFTMLLIPVAIVRAKLSQDNDSDNLTKLLDYSNFSAERKRLLKKYFALQFLVVPSTVISSMFVIMSISHNSYALAVILMLVASILSYMFYRLLVFLNEVLSS